MSSRRVFVIVAALAAATSASALPCESDWDCALNGLCVSGACACDAPWADGVGGACTSLVALPAPISACGPACAFHGNTTDVSGRPVNSSTWGARVVRAADGSFRMAVNEYAFGCGLSTWRSNSQIAWAAAATPLGPFRKLGVAVPYWATNPTVFSTPAGGLAIVTCGGGSVCAIGAASTPSNNTPECDNGAPCPCVGPPPGRCHYVQPSANATNVFHVAPDLATADSVFPWATLNVTIVNFTLGQWIPDLVNPSPLVLANGTALIMVHSAGTGGGAPVILRSVAGGADGWAGPYEVMTTAQARSWNGSVAGTEDPFLWQDARGNFHVMYHRLNSGWLGQHAWSRDGFTWSSTAPAYNNSFALEDGSALTPGANGGAQRPMLLQDASSGAVTHLYIAGATCDAGAHATCQPGPYTAVIPLASSSSLSLSAAAAPAAAAAALPASTGAGSAAAPLRAT